MTVKCKLKQSFDLLIEHYKDPLMQLNPFKNDLLNWINDGIKILCSNCLMYKNELCKFDLK